MVAAFSMRNLPSYNLQNPQKKRQFFFFAKFSSGAKGAELSA